MALSVGEAETRTPSRGHQATLMTGEWPGTDSIWAQLVDGRVANDVGSTVQISTQPWQATASTDADAGLQQTVICTTYKHNIDISLRRCWKCKYWKTQVCKWEVRNCAIPLSLSLSLSLSLRFNGHFPGEPLLAGVYWSKGWWRWW